MIRSPFLMECEPHFSQLPNSDLSDFEDEVGQQWGWEGLKRDPVPSLIARDSPHPLPHPETTGGSGGDCVLGQKMCNSLSHK